MVSYFFIWKKKIRFRLEEYRCNMKDILATVNSASWWHLIVVVKVNNVLSWCSCHSSRTRCSRCKLWKEDLVFIHFAWNKMECYLLRVYFYWLWGIYVCITTVVNASSMLSCDSVWIFVCPWKWAGWKVMIHCVC